MSLATEPGKPDTHIPGQPDMWAFVLFETLIFTGYFSVYLIQRTHQAPVFLHAQAQLDPRIGVLSTVVLLASSCSVARCVQSARAGAYRSAHRDALLTVFLAVVFAVSKVSEWAAQLHRGNGIAGNEFFTFYYFLTGIHFLHLLIGFVVLGIVIYQVRSPARRSQNLIETGATYWHTVDFLWVLIFALLYVVR